MSSSNCCFFTSIQVSQDTFKVVWHSHLFKNFPHFVVVHTVKGFSIVNKIEVDVFPEFPCFFYDQWTLDKLPDSLVGKESACNSGDPDSIPQSGRSTGERKGYPLQYSWPFLIAQLVKNLPAMLETPVWSLGWEDTLEKGHATHSSILA